LNINSSTNLIYVRPKIHIYIYIYQLETRLEKSHRLTLNYLINRKRVSATDHESKVGLITADLMFSTGQFTVKFLRTVTER
jgi:hypothetical protein